MICERCPKMHLKASCLIKFAMKEGQLCAWLEVYQMALQKADSIVKQVMAELLREVIDYEKKENQLVQKQKGISEEFGPAHKK